MIGYIVLKRKRFGDKMEIAEQRPTIGGLEDYAQDIYHGEQLDLVLIVEVSKDYINEDGMRYRKVFKIERACKHRNIQGDFLHKGFVCMECGMVFKPSVISSKIEDSLQPSGV